MVGVMPPAKTEPVRPLPMMLVLNPCPGGRLSVVGGLLPLLLIGGLIFFVVRSTRRQSGGLGGGLGQLTSLTKAKAKVVDGERPVTRFTDVAGSPAGKTEIR